MTVANRTGSIKTVTDGSFGEVSAPIFLNRLDCEGNELAIISYGRETNASTCHTSRIGFSNEQCLGDLGVRCPGKCVCVCTRVRERKERERVCVCVFV